MTNLAAKRKKRKVEGAANITDGCNPELVVGARFDGTLGIPVIEAPDKIKVPAGMVPFSKMGRVEDPRRFAVCEYELLLPPFCRTAGLPSARRTSGGTQGPCFGLCA